MFRKFLSTCLFVLTLTPAIKGEKNFTEQTAREYAKKFLLAWGGGENNLTKVLELYSEEATYEDPNVPKGLKGKKDLEPFFRILLRKYPDWKFETVSVFPIRNGFVLQYLGTIPLENGKIIRNFRGVDILHFQGEKISRHQGFYDRHVFFED